MKRTQWTILPLDPRFNTLEINFNATNTEVLIFLIHSEWSGWGGGRKVGCVCVFVGVCVFFVCVCVCYVCLTLYKREAA